MSTASVRIALVDDHLLFRTGIETILRGFENMQVVHAAGSAQEFLDWLDVGSLPPEVLLLDIEMPGMNGIELLKKLRQRDTNTKVIILSMHFRPALVSSMVESGVNGYLSKNCEPTELCAAILSVSKTDFYFNENVLRIMRGTLTGPRKRSADTTFGYGITEREKEVLQLICRECTTEAIAQQLFISIKTVEGHRTNLLLKSGAQNLAGLVLFAVRNHMVDAWF